MAVAENIRAEHEKDVENVARFFDVARGRSPALAAMLGIQAISCVMRGDTANFGSVERGGSPSPRLSAWTTGGLIEALDLLAEIAERELEKMEACQ